MKIPRAVRESGILFVFGALAPFALAPYDIWPLAIVSLAALCYYITEKTTNSVYFSAVCFNLGLFLSGVSWLYISIHEHGFVAAPLALIATLLFCAFLAVVSSLPFFAWSLVPQNRSWTLLAFPALWVLGEWLRSWLLTGFPWLFVGYSHLSTWVGGWAPIGGIFWLSFITAMAAACGAHALQGSTRSLVWRRCTAAIAVLIVSGYPLQHIRWTQLDGPELSVTLIQPNIPQGEKWSARSQRIILEKMNAQSLTHWGQDLIVWPEAAIPAVPQRIPAFLEELKRRALKSNTTLITGIPTFDDKTNQFYNSLLSIGANSAQYNKTRLVPFGEYVPLEDTLRGVMSFFDLPMSNFVRGAAEQPLLRIDDRGIATAICYEVVYPDLVARMSKGASFMLTVSNDTWFGDSLALPQHLQMAQMRALENAKPLVRATNNGLTALVDHKGKVTGSIPAFAAGELAGKIQPRKGQTVFSMWGSWPCISLCVAIMAGLWRTKTKA